MALAFLGRIGIDFSGFLAFLVGIHGDERDFGDTLRYMLFLHLYHFHRCYFFNRQNQITRR